MKLYQYDHCPYCVRVRVALELLGYEYELITLLNDDEATPISLVGKKVVPILVKDDGSAMPESLDIVNFLNQSALNESLETSVRPEIEAWLKQIETPNRYLLHPRNTMLPLPEFATESACTYYDEKKTASIGNFGEHLTYTPKYIAEVEALFEQLEALCVGEQFFREKASLEDVLLFPILRNLTAVAGLRYPERLKRYVATLSKQCHIATYEEHAI
ncbi:MAG: glutaredoxin 2 [Cardiobacteriaceae bacterium]|nr:glutaredoxin 2 [Cardiobacteriaceae bacterium]